MFNKDLLLIDVEATGLDINKHEMIEIGAILLDQTTLKAKTSFSSFIKPKHWERRSKPAMAVNKIKLSQLRDAPPLKTVLTEFHKTFPKDVIVSYYGGTLDIPFLKKSYAAMGTKYPFDYHVLDIWALFYVYMARKKKLSLRKKFPGFGLEDIAAHFKIKVPAERHTALADCLLEAEVLRHVVKAFRKI